VVLAGCVADKLIIDGVIMFYEYVRDENIGKY
jgi:hypothetical protein